MFKVTHEEGYASTCISFLNVWPFFCYSLSPNNQKSSFNFLSWHPNTFIVGDFDYFQHLKELCIKHCKILTMDGLR